MEDTKIYVIMKSGFSEDMDTVPSYYPMAYSKDLKKVQKYVDDARDREGYRAYYYEPLYELNNSYGNTLL